jgi:cation diffusion facilitator CzcD-associated flavoprotein CzcO
VSARAHDVVVIGAGFSGLGAAIRLKAAGIEDFAVLERERDVGGTWNGNRYPGCQCDVPSNLYCYSFAPHAGWTRTFSEREEIWSYLRDCVDRYELRPHLRLGVEVAELAWEERARGWRLDTSDGLMRARIVIAAMGALSEPALPSLAGIEGYGGRLFHSARWPAGLDLRGARVAVLGTGASAVQLIPEIQPDASELTVYQRTAPWVLPHPDRPTSATERALYRRAPFAQRVVRATIAAARETMVLGLRHPALLGAGERLGRRHLERQVADPALRELLRPAYRLGCKRILISNRYYPALTLSNVRLVPHEVTALEPGGVRAADGVLRPADVVIAATGFHVTDSPVSRRIRGRDGRTLAEHWDGSPQAHRGTAIAGFPNLFMLLGPHTGLGHTSVLLMIEAQLGYVLDGIRAMAARGVEVVEPRADAQAEWVAAVRRRARGTVWESGGCSSWYLDRDGHTVLWPDSARRFRRELARFDLAAYRARTYSSRSA